MKKYGLTLLMLVCFLISMPVSAVNPEFTNGEMVFENAVSAIPLEMGTEITINIQGEVTAKATFEVFDSENFDNGFMPLPENLLQSNFLT